MYGDHPAVCPCLAYDMLFLILSLSFSPPLPLSLSLFLSHCHPLVLSLFLAHICSYMCTHTHTHTQTCVLHSFIFFLSLSFSLSGILCQSLSCVAYVQIGARDAHKRTRIRTRGWT